MFKQVQEFDVTHDVVYYTWIKWFSEWCYVSVETADHFHRGTSFMQPLIVNCIVDEYADV